MVFFDEFYSAYSLESFLKGPRGGHSMYKPSDTCVNGVILRGVLFWESCFFGTVLLCNTLKSSIF
jgi:hypothetical protein